MATTLTKPDLPSGVVRWVGSTAPRIAPSENETVAIPITHDWGPLMGDAANAATGMPSGVDVYGSLPEWEQVYGNDDSPGRDAVIQAFLGMNVPGGSGAGAVLTPRMALPAAAAATLIRQNTTPANALTLTALWKGTRGNRFSIVIDADPQDAARDRLRVLFDGVMTETYSYVRTDIADLALQINSRPSRAFTAIANITGVALSPTVGTSLAGGLDGAAVTITEMNAALSALELQPFRRFAAMSLTDVPTKVAIANWVQVQADNMRPIKAFLGGAAGETQAAASAELNANAVLRNDHIVRFAVGTFHEDVENKNFGTADLAPRLAGIDAARGLRSALTSALLGGLSYVGATGPSSADLVTGRNQGLTMLKRVSHPDAKLAVSQGVTTFISRVTAGKPYEFFSDARIIGLLDDFTRRMTAWSEDVIVGDVTVTDDSRNEVRKEGGKILSEYESTGLAQLGTSFIAVQNTDGDPTLADTIPYTFGFKPARNAIYVIGEGRIS